MQRFKHRTTPSVKLVLLGVLLLLSFIAWTTLVADGNKTLDGHSQVVVQTQKAPFNDYSESEQKIWDLFEPVCEFLPHQTLTPVLQKVEMKMDTSQVDLADTASLEAFCAPYVYSRLVVDRSDGGCTDEDEVRGKDCGWYHMCVWDPEKDIYISKSIIQGDLWERFFVDEMRDTIKKSGKEGIVIDAGANIGQYTLLAAAAEQTVFAFEPIPDHTEMIKRSVALNGWSSRVNLYRNGLSDYRATSIINLHTFNKGGATIQNINTNHSKPTDGRFFDEIPLHLILLDDVLEDMKAQAPGKDIVFWKADVEGYESRMFRGSVKVWDFYKPSDIAFEVLGKSFPFTECYLEPLMNCILDLNYSITNMRSSRQMHRDEFKSFAVTWVEQKKDTDLVLRRL